MLLCSDVCKYHNIIDNISDNYVFFELRNNKHKCNNLTRCLLLFMSFDIW